ncbi:MarR family winged helix-turn-helix transcriptional regulator [Actinoplanes awajinensis]|uniref:HTH marR-type domain-containing protein n=1 Tax=Actinoplanes awajinensis subsp. mycoplanecinus TaxID=135947 RepID=A0A0X3VAL0_9ACTN|nr:MarR family transcriptional regulator [Actinoplanes awajinensis]KUL41831.1 hypothetical protein ADL15_02985 [Actinoplanes awajinensis subsp. mycoplanecinus]
MDEQAGPGDAWSQFVQAVFEVNGLINQAGEGIAGPLGQSSARWHVLGRAFRPQTVAAMAADMGHARQSVQRITDALERDGLIAYRPHPTDRRTQLVELTAPGRAVLEEIYQRQLAWSAGVTEQLGESTLRTLATSLRDVSRTLSDPRS